MSAHPNIAVTIPIDLSNDPEIIVRQLNADDAEAYCNIRHIMLTGKDGKWLAESPESHIGFTTEEEKRYWRELCTQIPGHRCVFGLIHKGQLIGAMTAATPPWARDRQEKPMLVLWGTAFLMPEYRGTKVGKKLYAAREQWSRDNWFKCAAAFFRREDKGEQKLKSRLNHEKHGAQPVRKFRYERMIKNPKIKMPEIINSSLITNAPALYKLFADGKKAIVSWKVIDLRPCSASTSKPARLAAN